jgi:hypothetical protein
LAVVFDSERFIAKSFRTHDLALILRNYALDIAMFRQHRGHEPNEPLAVSLLRLGRGFLLSGSGIFVCANPVTASSKLSG